MDSHISPKVGLCAEFQLDWFIGGCARECDNRTDGKPDNRMQHYTFYARPKMIFGPEPQTAFGAYIQALTASMSPIL